MYAQVNALNTQFSDRFRRLNFRTYHVKGWPAGLYKNEGRFSYLRVFGAGHEVPAYEYFNVERGAAALQMFEQIMSDNQLFNTF
jgi:hypothetical protein